MTAYFSYIRLYTPSTLEKGKTIELTPRQSHYVINVMRNDIGSKLRLFNGKEGEFIGKITHIHKRIVHTQIEEKIRSQEIETGPSLLFAPLKGERLGFLVEKATELGVSNFYPLYTERTVPSQVNFDKLDWRAMEAAEQCERMTLPNFQEVLTLGETLEAWDKNTPILFCEERTSSKPLYDTLSSLSLPCAFLVGPEGGFSDQEKELLHSYPFVYSVFLGKRILRSETAALAVLSSLLLFLEKKDKN